MWPGLGARRSSRAHGGFQTLTERSRVMNTIVVTYISYLCLSVALTVWVAQTLHKNGRIFLVDVFHSNEALADSVNHLLVVGFYLINFGFVCLALKLTDAVPDARGAIEALASKVGMVLLVLGGMHFFNLAALSKIRRPSSPNP